MKVFLHDDKSLNHHRNGNNPREREKRDDDDDRNHAWCGHEGKQFKR